MIDIWGSIETIVRMGEWVDRWCKRDDNDVENDGES